MNKFFLLLIACCLPLSTVYAQSNDKTTDTTIRSTILDEERLLKIHLPEDYNEEVLYPVIYITDAGGPNFNVAKNYLEVLPDPTYDVIPNCILVGIVHKSRNKDLNVFQEESGKQFMRHLFEEVVPMIDSTYSTSGFNIMIGHSDGAEYNHFLLLSEENPFRGFISLSTMFRSDVKTRISDFLKAYKGANLYYFIANGKSDHPNRIKAGNDFEALTLQTPNERIKFKKNTYQAGHNDLVPFALIDGLRHVFQDYGNIEAYPSIIDYAENYLSDLKANYGIEGKYDIYEIVPYLDEITTNKDIDGFKYFVNFVEEHKLWINPKSGEPAGLDPVNIANAYYGMGLMPEVIKYWNIALEEFDSVEDQVFYANLSKVLKAYKSENSLAEAVDFMEMSIEKLPEKYTLRMNYKLAKFSLENKVSSKKGKKSLKYCRENYRQNRVFTVKDLDVLEKL